MAKETEQQTMETIKIEIAGRDIPDFYSMVRWHIRNSGNTFVYLKQELDAKYPELKAKYGDDDDTEYFTVKQRRHRQDAIVRGYQVKKGYDERMNIYKPKWLIDFEQDTGRKSRAFERNMVKLGFTIIELEDDGEE